MSAGIHQGGDGEEQRRMAARGADRADAAFQRGDSFFEHADRRIADPGIDMAGAFQVEQRRRMVGIVEHIGRGLIDRHCACAGHRIRLLTRMQRE